MASAKELLDATATIRQVVTALEGLVSIAFTCPTTLLHNKRALDEITNVVTTFEERVAYGAETARASRLVRARSRAEHAGVGGVGRG